ncbi:MAG TPA: gamma-glutamyl-gamma-aminobutyrate hydrolase family protein [Longimicrobiales bacterium]
MRPLVAVTSTLVPEAGPYQRPEIALYAIYVRVLERIGLASLLVTPVHTFRSLPSLLDQCDGLVLTGGEDVDPGLYGEAPIPELGLVNRPRDRMELAALKLALKRRMPILAICRGCQLVNVCFGGTLYQDLATQRPGTELMHQQVEAWERRTHRARIRAGSRLARIVECEDLLINSFHHQGIKDLGTGLDIVAVADDGTVEAVEARDYPWLIGVQWHPERYEATAPARDPDRRLMGAFRDAVHRHSRGRGGPPAAPRVA